VRYGRLSVPENQGREERVKRGRGESGRPSD
jgi:hypothetical protein